MSNELVIRAKDLCKDFGSQRVLDRITLDVFSGETLVIMGGSGCGKSTLLRLLIGSLEPTSGAIEVFGAPLDASNEKAMYEVPKSIWDPLPVRGALQFDDDCGQCCAAA